ncbi:hypothetical protein B0H13DRAFT_1935746 [Mycena leptocephala]|nr:hypothetical protein B0H13DRAFT_1935746 [Mycena leptocephala]
MTHDAEARSKHSPADQEFLDGMPARQLMDFRDHDNDSWDLGGGGGRAKVRFMKIMCDAKCLAVDPTRSRAPAERKRVPDEDISARPPKRRARSITYVPCLFAYPYEFCQSRPDAQLSTLWSPTSIFPRSQFTPNLELPSYWSFSEEPRGCPALPLNGPVLLKFIPAPSLAPSSSTPAVTFSGRGSLDISPGVMPSKILPQNSQCSSRAHSHPLTFKPRTWWFVPLVLVPVTVLLAPVLDNNLYLLQALFAAFLWFSSLPPSYPDVRLSSDTSGSCPAWPGSGALAFESCPRLDSGYSLPKSSPYLCPMTARRGDVDFMARGGGCAPPQHMMRSVSI